MSKAMRGTGNLYQRGATWWIVYHVRGQRVRESAGSAHRPDAVRLLKRRLGEAGQGRPVGPSVERTTFEDLARMIADDYAANGHKSTERLTTSLHHLRGTFGMLRAIDLTADRLTAYVRTRQEEGAARSTVRNELAALKRAFRLAYRAGHVAQVPPFPTVSVQNARTGFFEPEQFAAVLKRLPAPLQPVMEFAYLTGWRKREILGLTWARVDFTAGVLRLDPGTTKNDEGRSFPFAVLPALASLLKAQRDHTTTVERARQQIIPWVFHRNGRPVKSYDVAWRAACTAAGLPGRLVHDFRRTAVRNLERAGVSRSVAMQLTGHKTESVYRRYAIVVEADLREGVTKLAGLHARSATVSPQSATAGGNA